MVTSLNRQPSATTKLMSGRNNDKEARTNHWGRELLPPLFHSVLIHNCPNKQSYTVPRVAHLIMFVCIAPKIKHSMVGYKSRTLWFSPLPSALSLSHSFKPPVLFAFPLFFPFGYYCYRKREFLILESKVSQLLEIECMSLSLRKHVKFTKILQKNKEEKISCLHSCHAPQTWTCLEFD